MGYTLGTLVPLAGGGYVAANERSATIGGNPGIELYVQLYDANRLAVGSSVVVGQAFSNAISGAFATITGYDLAAAPNGGFDVIYMGKSADNASSPTFVTQGGAFFDAQGGVLKAFSTTYGLDMAVAPHLVALINGGLIIQQDWTFWVYNANGKEVSQVGGSGAQGDLIDLVTVVATEKARPDGTIDQWLFRLDPTGAPDTVIGTAVVKTVTGTSGDDVLTGSAGPDIISGGAGNDILTGGFGFDTLTGGAGADRFVFGLDGSVDRVTDFDPSVDTLKITDLQGGALPVSAASVLTFDARSHVLYWDDDGAAGPHAPTAVAILQGVSHIGLSNLVGFAPALLVNISAQGAYEITGSGSIVGGAAAEKLIGGAGADYFIGGGGNDVIDGGAGWDGAAFNGNRSDYTVTQSASGVVTVTDNRSQSPDGTDTLTHVEYLQFKDQKVILGPTTVADALAFGLPLVLREATPTAADAAWRDGLLAQQGLTVSGAVAAIVSHAAATTTVATLAYQFFTGGTPTEGGMDYLISPTGSNPNNLGGAYYQNFNLENRYINFAVNLGKYGQGHDSFQAAYGSLSLHDATKLAYQTIFGIAPSDAKVDALMTSARADYLASYGLDGATGIGTKAAMVGWLLAEAVKADVGLYALSNDAYLTDVITHQASLGVDLVGTYGQPGFFYHPG